MACGIRAFRPVAATRKPPALAGADRIDGQHAAARNGLLRDHHHVEQQFYLVLRQEFARQIPRDLGLVVLEMPRAMACRVADVDLRAGRAGSPKRQPAELQSRRRGLGALADQVEREFAVVGLRIVVEHLEPVDDGADRTDEIVAHPRAQQCGEFEDVGRRGRETKGRTSNCSRKAAGQRESCVLVA